MILLSVDPGLRACGCALWSDGELLAADWVKQRREPSDLVDSVALTVRAVREWALCREVPTTVAVEIPQTYGGRAASGDANDLISLALVVGGLQSALEHAQTYWARPSEWKGQTPKGVIEARAREALGPLVSRVLKSNDHVWDAVGIGLWWLRKLRAR